MGCNEEGGGEQSCCFQLRTLPDRPVKDVLGGSVAEIGNNNNSQFFPATHNPFAKKARVDVSFENLRFTVKEWTLSHPVPVSKDILKSVNGVFPAGELTAIMGPSGAGKSTLLNVLAAFTMKGTSGRVMLNRKERDPVKFKKQSCYIQQDNYLRKELTVAEAMTFAADLKLARNMSKAKKQELIRDVLEMLGLGHCTSTVSGRLSGGQKKRLSLALELLSNPPVIFLDEPTTGLDSSSCTLCVSLLKFLAMQGRTVVCTIHQPSSLVFEKFDNLYALEAGRCLYSGKIRDLVPYLADFGLICPQYHNPADFLLDVAIGDFGADLDKLAVAAEKSVKKILAEIDVLENENQVSLIGGVNNNRYTEEMSETEQVTTRTCSPFQYMSKFLFQTSTLIKRRFRMIYRKPANMIVRAVCHLFIALLFGYLYRDMGVNGDTVLANYVWIYGSNLFLVYTAKMAATLLFPMELEIVTHEHFNSWYKLTPYYLSLMLVEIPFQAICCWLYLPISFFLTGNPLTPFRILYFCVIGTILSLVSQAIGLLIGITVSRKIAVFLGPVMACVLSISGFCLRYSDTPWSFRWLYHISYFRASFHVAVKSIYGYSREKLPCPDVHCPFADPRLVLRELDSGHIDTFTNSAYTVACLVLAHILTYIAVWYRLNRK